jgi:FO synthase
VAPNDLPIARWIEVVEAAHAAGFSTSSVLFSGHVETAADRVAHLRTLLRIQERSHGFTEFVPITAPAAALAPGAPSGVPLVAGRSAIDEARAQVAVSRLMLSGRIQHVQIPWPRLDLDEAAVLLRSGGDDLGGALLDGRVLPEAGVEHGRELPVAEAQRLAHRLLRPFRQRTTTYGEPSAERKAVSRGRMVPGVDVAAPGRSERGSRTIDDGTIDDGTVEDGTAAESAA